MSKEQARLKFGRMAAELAGISHDHPRFDEVATKAAKVKPDDFFELNGDEIEARFVLGEEDADAIADGHAELKRPLRRLARCLLTLADSRKLMIALDALRGMSAKRRGARFDDAVCDLLKRWGTDKSDAGKMENCEWTAVVDSLPRSFVGGLCWRLCETHSTEGDKSGINAAQRAKDIARRKRQGKTWDEIAVEFGGNADAVKKASQARQERLNP